MLLSQEIRQVSVRKYAGLGRLKSPQQIYVTRQFHNDR
jgi:hypothetical protein